MRNFGRRLILSEAKGGKSPSTKTTDAFAVCEKLRPQLATLMGDGGFRALFSRALALASAEVPWLRGVHIKPDGVLGGVNELPTHLSLDDLSEGRVVLLAHLLELLVAFIGADLTLRLVEEVWPKAHLNNLNLANGNQNEKTK